MAAECQQETGDHRGASARGDVALVARDVTLAHDDVNLAAGDVTILHAKRVPMGVKNSGVFYRSFRFVLDDSRPAQPRSSDKKHPNISRCIRLFLILPFSTSVIARAPR